MMFANAVANITAIKPKLMEKINKLKSITLNQSEKDLAKYSIPLNLKNT